jgi:hypothetical protein
MLDAQGRVVQSAETINRNVPSSKSIPVRLDAKASTKLMVLTLKDKVLAEVAPPQKIHVRRADKNLELVVDGDFSEGADFIINNYFEVCKSNDCRIYGYDQAGRILEYQTAGVSSTGSWSEDLFGHQCLFHEALPEQENVGLCEFRPRRRHFSRVSKFCVPDQ